MFTNKQQTAKLIELRMPRPRCLHDGALAYSIGELIEIHGFHLSSIRYLGIMWFVNAKGIAHGSEELVDALYDMITHLKEDGVI